jgi:hypothetical protein
MSYRKILARDDMLPLHTRPLTWNVSLQEKIREERRNINIIKELFRDIVEAPFSTIPSVAIGRGPQKRW